MSAKPAETSAPKSVMLLTIPETAVELRVKSTDTVYRLIAREHLPVVKIGGVTRVNRAALQRWINARSRAA